MNNQTMNQKTKKGKDTPKMRRIEIETDGNNIHLIKAEVSGKIELIAILRNLIGYLSQPPVPEESQPKK